MSIIDDFKNRKLTLEELKQRTDSDPQLAKEVGAYLTDQQLSDDELEEIAAAGLLGLYNLDKPAV